MIFLRILYLKLKNTLLHRHNLLLLAVTPILAAAGAWALAVFYLEGGANIPVAILDYDKTDFSRTAAARFSDNSAVGTRVFETGAFDDDPAYDEAVRLIRINTLEAAVVIFPGFEENIRNGGPEDVYSVICTPGGISRGLAAELFAAQVSRLYFNCDSANRVVTEAIRAARVSRSPPLTDAQIDEIYENAFAYCDSYWEPQPLMTVEYKRYQAPRQGAQGLAGGGWNDMRDMLNDLLSRAVFAIIFAYAVFCIVNATGVMTGEREDGVLTRLKASGYPIGAWIAVSAAAPFIIYGVPGAALLSFLNGGAAGGAVLTFAALLCVSALGASAAYYIKKQGRYKIFTLVCTILSLGISIFISFI